MPSEARQSMAAACVLPPATSLNPAEGTWVPTHPVGLGPSGSSGPGPGAGPGPGPGIGGAAGTTTMGSPGSGSNLSGSATIRETWPVTFAVTQLAPTG